MNVENDEGLETPTTIAQRETEESVLEALSSPHRFSPQMKTLTIEYLHSGLVNRLNPGFSSLDASKPWLCYWMVHSLSILEADEVISTVTEKLIFTLSHCQHPSQGGFGGGFLQLPHTAPTFGAIMALVSLRNRQALQLIHRKRLYAFFLSLKLPNGGFQVHEGGECDSRAMYTVLACASLLNMCTKELMDKCGEWIATTQSFDGGLGGEPGNESHGGYAYCGLASLVILKQENPLLFSLPSKLNMARLQHWLSGRQMQVEGGFQGRTNKLVDSCYSFWQGASFSLMQRLGDFPCCQADRLTEYVFGACAGECGGFKDKPDTNRDFYHTCYALSGVSVVNSRNTGLRETDPVYNVTIDRLGFAKAYFAKLESSHSALLLA